MNWPHVGWSDGITGLEGQGRTDHRRCAETADLDVDVATVAQGSDELSHMHPRASVDGGRIFLADDVDAHGSTVVIEALARQWQAQRGSPVSSAAAYP